jgi:hypothetical protein
VGVRSTEADLSRLVLATMAGTAPGADAAEPRFAADDGDRIGYGWFTHRYGNRTITWHNGGTGGFRSYVAFDRASGRGVVVLSNTDRAVEWIGLRMLGVDPPSAAGWRDLLRPGVTVALLMFAAGSLLLLAVRTARGSLRRGPDRLRVLEETLATAAMLLITHRIGAWLTIPPWWWSAAVGVAAAGVTALALRWRTTPTRDGRGPAARSAQLAVSGAISLLIIGAMAAHL